VVSAALERRTAESESRNAPLVVFHNVGIVASYSYKLTVKPYFLLFCCM
jgi:hypothetical protein